MSPATIHNPDRYMIDFRQILSHSRKRIGLLVGAGAPVSIRVDGNGELDKHGSPLIPDVAGLTTRVTDSMGDADRKVIGELLQELGPTANIEQILTRVRRLAQAIGKAKIHGCDGAGYAAIAERLCSEIGQLVNVCLPKCPNPFTQLVSWIGGTAREHPIEVFTPNYDLLLEEAFERARLPFFDGFSGSHRPFFDPASIASDVLPPRWSRVWKIHGSLGWEATADAIVRTGSRSATKLIYPDHLKYDHVSRQPYSALFERLRGFLLTPDTLLICTGFSFADAHISSVLEESLAANAHTAVLAIQYSPLEKATQVTELAFRRPNLSVYCPDGAVIFGVRGRWQPDQPPTEEWETIRSTFWQNGASPNEGRFLLGDFADLARFFSLSQASNLGPRTNTGAVSESSTHDSSSEATGSQGVNA